MAHLDTLLAQAGTEPDPQTGAMAPPIHTATTYARRNDGSAPDGFVYSRNDNPTRRRLEETLAAAEGGAACIATSSGMAAVMTLLQTLKTGDHVLLPEDIYYGVRELAHKQFGRWGLEVSEVDMAQPEAVKDAIRDTTRFVWVESPSNPQLNVTDIAAVGHMAHAAGAKLVVDNTWPSPLITRPIELGADIVLHSVTKYLGGHSDVLGGALIFKEQTNTFEKAHALAKQGGAVLDPFGAWLTMRGMRTLGPRLRQQSATALALAQWLQDHPAIERVRYPGLESHPGHEIAKRQMTLFGGMLSFQVKGGAKEALSVVAKTRLFANATSLGGTESLMEHRASVEGDDSPTPKNLLRVSVGLEHMEDLMADLDRALSA
ncbi:MAG: aminotransferase class V-fold PLP-dependent enzyme [Bacteroidota bacterium]|nr:aminotransferase class V-fold PLP-dependent enzyme [Bacteroidota bacterium]